VYNSTTIAQGLGAIYPSKILAWGLGISFAISPPEIWWAKAKFTSKLFFESEFNSRLKEGKVIWQL